MKVNKIIVPVVSYESETWHVTVRDDPICVYDNRILRKIHI
jgi:hypothetical protein